MRLVFWFSLAALMLGTAVQAYAGAWTMAPHKWFISQSASFYEAADYWNNQGQKQSQPYYSKLSYTPYFEYGLKDGITLGGSINVERVNQKIDAFRIIKLGIGDSEFFSRFRVWQRDNYMVSLEPFVKLPTLSRHELPNIGSKYFDSGLAANGGYGFDAFGQHHYVDVTAAYRYRFGQPQNQIQLNGTLGLSLTPRWMVMPQLFITRRTGHSDFTPFTLSPSNDYDLTRLQLSTIYKFHRHVGVQLGGFMDVSGRNTGVGRGVVISLWKGF